MALMKCKECGETVSNKAKTCPKCGAPIAAKKPSGCALVFVIIFGGGMVLSALTSLDKRPREPEAVAPREPQKDQVKLISFRCEVDSIGNAFIAGEAQNITDAKFDALLVKASFYDADRKLLDSGSGYAEIRPVLAGQVTAFKVYGPRNPLTKLCGVTGFSSGILGGQLRWTDASK